MRLRLHDFCLGLLRGTMMKKKHVWDLFFVAPHISRPLQLACTRRKSDRVATMPQHKTTVCQKISGPQSFKNHQMSNWNLTCSFAFFQKKLQWSFSFQQNLYTCFGTPDLKLNVLGIGMNFSPSFLKLLLLLPLIHHGRKLSSLLLLGRILAGNHPMKRFAKTVSKIKRETTYRKGKKALEITFWKCFSWHR